jgi:hypothetical protein
MSIRWNFRNFRRAKKLPERTSSFSFSVCPLGVLEHYVCQLSLAARAALDTKWHDNNIDGHAWGEDALPVSVNSMLCLHSMGSGIWFRHCAGI